MYCFIIIFIIILAVLCRKGAWDLSLNHWTAREVPRIVTLKAP